MEVLLGLAAVTAPAAVAVLLGLLGLSFPLAWLGAALVGGALGWAWWRRDRQTMRWIIALLASVLSPLLLLGFAVDAIHVASSWYPTVTLGGLVPSSEVVAVDDGVVRTELEGVDLAEDRPVSDNGLSRDYVAAPLVDDGWTRTEAAPTWVRCEGEPGACRELFRHRPLVGTVWSTPRDHELAVAHAIAQHHIDAPGELLVLQTHAEATLDAWATLIAFALALVMLNVAAVRRGRS